MKMDRFFIGRDPSALEKDFGEFGWQCAVIAAITWFLGFIFVGFFNLTAEKQVRIPRR